MGERTCACGDKKSGARTIETRNETLVFPNHFRLPSRARPTPASSPHLPIHPLYQYLHLKRISIASLMFFCRLWTSPPCSKSSTTRAKLDAQFSGPEIPRFRADFAGTFLFVFLNHSLSLSIPLNYETPWYLNWNQTILKSNNILLDRILNWTNHLKLPVSFPMHPTMNHFSLKKLLHYFLTFSGAGAVFDQRPYVQQSKWQEYISRF